MAAIPSSAPLFEKFAVKRTTDKVLDVIILCLLFSLLAYRLPLLFSYRHGCSWLQITAFLCESWFTFISLLVIAVKWTPVHYKPYPDRLLQRMKELPAVDIFVTTADSTLEPPIITVNTVLSLLAVDYPANRTACYVSDDGCSPATFYSLSEALRFAKIWVPFCRKYGVQVRAPFRYFSNSSAIPTGESPEFQQEWKKMKDEYELLCQKIEEAGQKPLSGASELAAELAVFSGVDPKNHAPIVKVLWENKEGLEDGLPHLIYVSREKRAEHPHNYKAGALNVLGRISGLMTNAPYILNVDCDMYTNNPSIILQGMCHLVEVDPKSDQEVAFVQFPQRFYTTLKDDPFGNQFIVFMEYVIRGLAGIQGPCYMGTGCIHRRKVIYGQSPECASINAKIPEKELYKSFGNSKEFVKSASRALLGVTDNPNSRLCFCSIEALNEAASCTYEYGSSWGSQVGWLYGSATEDIFTGMIIQKKGWKSIYLNPEPPAFLGCAPGSGPASLTQLKRWSTGFLEIFFSKNCPIFATLFAKLQLRQSMFYVWVFLWGLCSIPELCYSALPPYCLITGSHFLPKVQESEFSIPLSLFVVLNLQQLLQYLKTGQSVRAWWNNQKMVRVNTMCGYLFGAIGIVLKLLGLSETTFEVTKKTASSSSSDEDSGEFTFDESPLFVPGTTVLMMQLTGLLIGIWRQMAKSGGVGGLGVGEGVCSVWLIMCFWSFMKGMFRKGRYGLPFSTLCKSSVLTAAFVYFSQMSVTMGFIE